MLLEKLSNARGVSGNEAEVRELTYRRDERPRRQLSHRYDGQSDHA